MERAFSKNDRVRLSEKGRLVMPRTPPDRVGTICHEPRTGVMVCIKWDGTKSKYSLHYTMLERVDAGLK